MRVILRWVPRNSGVDRLGPDAVLVCFLVQPNFHRRPKSVGIDAKKVSLADQSFDERGDAVRVKVDRRMSTDGGKLRVDRFGALEAIHV